MLAFSKWTCEQKAQLAINAVAQPNAQKALTQLDPSDRLRLLRRRVERAVLQREPVNVSALFCRSPLLELQMLDITTTPIEIAPTSHYSMGGVWVRPDDHSTDVAGPYAIGEASSGLHGAHRLGGNSLIELLVFGRIVGNAAAEYSESLTAHVRSADAVDEARKEISGS